VAQPGEVSHAIGQAYQYVFVGALEHSIKYFKNQFHVHESPEKLTFKGRSGDSFSFDFSGVYRHPWLACEVFGESKGYSRGGSLLWEFKLFIAKAYVTSIDHSRHRNDLFWFVTNVPFACSEGRDLLSTEFFSKALTDPDPEIRRIVGNPDLDPAFIHQFVGRVSAFVLTDSFLQQTDICYKVRPGDTLWSILKLLHAGQAPSGFRSKAQTIARYNDLLSPDKIKSGKVLRLNWSGLGSRRSW
jgi:hypothetical protein